MKDIKYVTQLTHADLSEIRAATDPEAGFCISIQKINGKLTIGIDKRSLALAINGFVRNGGTMENAAGCQNVSFDPPS